MSMIDSLGAVAYPLLLVSLLTLVQIGRGVIDVLGGDGPGSPLKIHSVLVLGALGSCVGLVGSLMGVQAMATAIRLRRRDRRCDHLGGRGDYRRPVRLRVPDPGGRVGGVAGPAGYRGVEVAWNVVNM